ncbi:hypothetical protein FN846DRAFT_1001759 [Sphaerosporella brunnea]|uniref:HNH nuclease domain-containing protein n=1 Tax=Sphaerosporella brunnea TaxID=1250544 RepID=A0A5J5EG76_9PEZI|nr:hypothetical protein FN846DRAFT_1001759 [Sphaerosporella brunnea]
MDEDPLPSIHYSQQRVPFADYRAASLALSWPSGTHAFTTGIRDRDGDRCVICNHGVPGTVDNSHIVPRSDPQSWKQLKDQGWIAAITKSVVHEPRNGIRLCKNCHYGFDKYRFCIRFIPQREQYVFVNWARYPEYRLFHGLALRLDPNHRLAPFMALFLWHEDLVRATHSSLKPLPVPLVKTGFFQPDNLVLQDANTAGDSQEGGEE